MEIVDVYTHCGISKYEPIERVRAVMAAAGVNRAVLVQHLGEFDNGYIESVVASGPGHFAGVGLVDHTSARASDDLRRMAGSGRFRGVRYITDVIVAATRLLDEAAAAGLIIMLWAPDGIADFVAPLHDFFARNPDARLGVTHLGTPDPSDGPEFERARRVFELAQYPGAYMHISGMKMFCPYPHQPLYGLIEEAVETFGPSRLCWGSNYPVCGSETDYVRDLRLLLDGGLPIPLKAIAAVAGANAGRIWFGDA